MNERLFECHWQDRADHTRSVCIAQRGFTDEQVEANAVIDWANGVFEQRKAEMPDGWCPMIRMLQEQLPSEAWAPQVVEG